MRFLDQPVPLVTSRGGTASGGATDNVTVGPGPTVAMIERMRTALRTAGVPEAPEGGIVLRLGLVAAVPSPGLRSRPVSDMVLTRSQFQQQEASRRRQERPIQSQQQAQQQQSQQQPQPQQTAQPQRQAQQTVQPQRQAQQNSAGQPLPQSTTGQSAQQLLQGVSAMNSKDPRADRVVINDVTYSSPARVR